MAIDLQSLYDLPDISVIENMDIESIKEEMVADYESFYQAETGESITLYPADRDRIKLNVVANKLYQAYQYIEKGFRMNFLKYASGKYLDHLGAGKKTLRQEAHPAVTVLRFSLEEIRAQVTAIPKGKRATAGDNIFFETDDYAEIAAGAMYVDVQATCTVSGIEGNGYVPGQINVLADPVSYVANVKNITKSDGGSSRESDTDYRERIFLAPSAYSTAGPEDAYIYWVKQYNSAAIKDVKPHTTEDSVVDIRLILTGGELPSEAFLADLAEYLESSGIRPLTDKVVVAAPDIVEYDLDFTYYISRSNKNNVEAIQETAEDAANQYVLWQKTHIGTDINTDILVGFLRAAGIKRVVIRSPMFTTIKDTQIAMARSVTMLYGGLEDD